MNQNPFTTTFERLPVSLPVFPLADAIVMPGTQLPLNIFEPRYLNLITDVLGEGRQMGMIQPDSALGGNALSRTGCCGRISSFNETDDGRFSVVLTGVCRFDISEEMATTRGYRRVIADWSRFSTDYEDGRLVSPIDRERLMHLLRTFAEINGAEVHWDSFEKISDTLLVNVLTTNLPLESAQKQQLIEAVALEDRAWLLDSMLEAAIGPKATVTPIRH